MRILINLMLAGLISMSAMASTPASSLSIEKLTGQVWLVDAFENGTTYYDFQEPMSVDIITKKANGKLVWNTAFWNLERSEDGIYLILKQTFTGDENRFRVSVDNDKLILTSDKLQTILSAISVDKAEFVIVKKDLIGNWKSPFYDLKDQSLANADTKVKSMWKQGLEFNEDGTFTRHQQVGRSAEKESGVWSLSKDGAFIKLHFARDGNVEDIYKKEVLNIEEFKNDWMRVHNENSKKSKNISVFDLKKHS